MLPIYLGTFILSGSVLLLEIALTRVMAIMMWHHFTYLVVSLALLGFGAAGSILTVQRQGLRTDSPARTLALLSLAYGATLVVAFLAATRVPVDSIALWADKTNLAWLALVCALLFVPFLLAGAVIGLVLTRLVSHVNRLYFADLVGSAAGGALALWLLPRVGGGATVVIAAALGAIAGLAFALRVGRRMVLTTLPVVAAALWLAIGFSGGLAVLHVPALTWPIPFAPGKELAKMPAEFEVERLPSATAEVEVGPSVPSIPILGGDFGAVDRAAVVARFVGQDGTAPTMLFKDAVELDTFPFLDDSQAGSAYVAFAARGGRAPDVLVIGVGGGIDVMIALQHGARRVAAVEINQAMIDMVTSHYGTYLGGLFRPGTNDLTRRIALHHGEGRSFVRGRSDRYDIIQMSGVDSFTALSTGANTLSESYLYTVEAVRDFYEHLRPNGYINYSRFILTRPRKPRETLRLANIARAALEADGIRDAASRIAVFRGQSWASTMIKRGPFTRAEMDALQSFAERERFWGLVYDPLHPAGTPFPAPPHVLATARRRVEAALRTSDAALAGAGVVVDGLTEAVQQTLRGDESGAAATVAALVAVAPPALRAERRATLESVLRTAVARSREQAAPFHETRRDFETLLRGGRAERAAFVADYEYNLTPATDDSPFFFNYYRYGGLLRTAGSTGRARVLDHLDKYHPDYPVGHLVLLVSQIQITILAALLILLPLRSLSRAGRRAPGRWRIFGYFAALGAGFMAIELVLLQRLILFLGHPTHTLAVVLCTLLTFTGLGSLLAERIGEVRQRTLVRLLVLILLALGVSSIVVGRVFPFLLGWPLSARIAVTIAVLAPLGLALGAPFPTGLRVVRSSCPELLPWAWGINGFLSVLASLLTITLSMALGFSIVLALAAGVYVIGFASLLLYLRGPGASGAGP